MPTPFNDPLTSESNSPILTQLEDNFSMFIENFSDVIHSPGTETQEFAEFHGKNFDLSMQKQDLFQKSFSHTQIVCLFDSGSYKHADAFI